jgi:hypothetical protein
MRMIGVPKLLTYSVHPENEAYNFMIVEAKNNKGMIEQIMNTFKRSSRNHA